MTAISRVPRRSQHASKGVAAHYDLDIATSRRTHAARSPALASVLYLDEAGPRSPTFVVDRAAPPDALEPRPKQQGNKKKKKKKQARTRAGGFGVST